MVVKMMRWPPWPPVYSRKFEATIVLCRLEGLNLVEFEGIKGLVVEIKWKGQKGGALSSLRRSVKKNFTKEKSVDGDGVGVVEWDEEFKSNCNFSGFKDGAFWAWEVAFTVFNGSNQGQRNKVHVLGTASLNLAEFASAAEERKHEISVPLTVPGGTVECGFSLTLSLSLLEVQFAQEHLEIVQREMLAVPLSPFPQEALLTEKNEVSALKAGLRKVKIFRGYVSGRKAKKACQDEEGSDGKSSVRSEEAEYNYTFDTDSLDDDAKGESEEIKEDSSFRKSFSYETLAYANGLGLSFYSNTKIKGEDEDWIYYSNRKSDVGRFLHVEDSNTSAHENSYGHIPKRRIFSWKKRKLNFRSPKVKGEPLLKKYYREEGGDDIDFDRRQFSSSDESSFGWCKTEENSTTNRSSVSEFGEDNFAVGSWELKEVINRDECMKFQGQVFFASIDQRSESAAGESACTALVFVIAEWLQSNQDEIPIKSEFDSLIREGSSEWRNLCENEAYRERFPDKHFDLETILQAKIRPLCVAPEKSFIGFFHPEGLEEGGFDFLQGAMSFDNMWDEISGSRSSPPRVGVYIVSWNDHFFVLKVELDAYYIIDTLGERLYEGCSQAYVLKFDKETTIRRLENEKKAPDSKPANCKDQLNISKENSAEGTVAESSNESENRKREGVCRGKESCKEYIKSFLAAIPIRQLQDDIKKGLMASTPLHHRLQIEFHFTRLLQPVAEHSPSSLPTD